MASIKNILILLFAFYFIFLLFMYLQQRHFLFFPHASVHRPDEQDISSYSLSVQGIRLGGWQLKPNQANKGLILYYGGNAEDIFYALPEFRQYKDFSTLLVNYRGYGSSEGDPGEQELYGDAIAVYDDMVQKFSPERIVVMGRSLGSGIATYVASRRHASACILVTPYDSILNIAKKQYPFLPVSLLLKHPFHSADHAERMNCPTLIIYGGQDTIIPRENTLNLAGHIAHKKIIYIENADHNNIESFEQYNLAIKHFLQHMRTP